MMDFIQFDQSKIKSVKDYWTDERMANAIPLPLPHVEMPEIRQQEDDEFAQAETEMVFCNAEIRPQFNVPVYYAFKVRDMDKDPYRKVGRLYCTKSNGDNYSATAQFVGADNILMAAAHSTKPDGQWAENMMFYRACSNATAQQELKAVVSAASINSMWEKLSPPARSGWDYAFLKTTEPSNVGYLELSFNLPFLLKSISYPVAYGNNSRYMCEAHGSLDRCTGNIIVMQPNFMDSGASGGGWFPRHGGNEIVGITSGGCDIKIPFGHNKRRIYRPHDRLIYGPRFDQETVNQFERFLIQIDLNLDAIKLLQNNDEFFLNSLLDNF